MNVPSVTDLARFVRDRLAGVSDTLTPLWGRRDGVEVLPPNDRPQPDHSVLAALDSSRW
jgi:hypothetical protein